MHSLSSSGHIKQFAQTFLQLSIVPSPNCLGNFNHVSQWSDINLFGIIRALECEDSTQSQLQLTSGKSVSVEEPRIERILPREMLTRQRLTWLTREAKEGREPVGQGDWRPGQGGEDSRVMEAG